MLTKIDPHFAKSLLKTKCLFFVVVVGLSQLPAWFTFKI